MDLKVVEINGVNYGSTGSIAISLCDRIIKENGQAFFAYPPSRTNAKKDVAYKMKIGSRLERNVHVILAYYFGLNGFFSVIATKRFLKEICQIHPDIIHLHNIHNCYLCLPLFFSAINKMGIPIVWTLHDCWAFTGQCPHFTFVNCDKWKAGCRKCPQFKCYPKSLFDNTKIMWKKKKKWFTNVDNLYLVTPSVWLSNMVKQSFLKNKATRVVNNGIDLGIFKPTESDFREKHSISSEKKIILGVAFGWTERKGIDVFLRLSKMLDPDLYQVVLVGTNENVDRKLPNDIISIHRTSDQIELAKIYTAADVFVNPTREENFPTVNIEALACGTPVITFDTGGSPEIVDKTCGSVVPVDDLTALEKEIAHVCKFQPYSKEACLRRARLYDKNERIEEYTNLFKELTRCIKK